MHRIYLTVVLGWKLHEDSAECESLFGFQDGVGLGWGWGGAGVANVTYKQVACESSVPQSAEGQLINAFYAFRIMTVTDVRCHILA